jgi:peptidylprolyl isomerase
MVVLLAVALVPSHGFAQQPAGAGPAAASAPAAAPDVTPPADAATSGSGLATKVLTAGSGSVHPTPTDTVKFTFVGYKKDGSSFNSPPNYTARVSTIAVAGLVEGLQLMVPGEKRRMWMPEKLAFNGAANKPAGPLVFDVELIEVIQAPQTPADVAAPPAAAVKTKSGLASVVLKPGTGTTHPTKTSNVTVHYSGWTTNGKLFDTTVLRDEPAGFPVTAVIPGWTEGLQLMVEGEKTRFWIPAKLAYNNDPEKPLGMLVFDVELVKIK